MKPPPPLVVYQPKMSSVNGLFKSFVLIHTLALNLPEKIDELERWMQNLCTCTDSFIFTARFLFHTKH